MPSSVTDEFSAAVSRQDLERHIEAAQARVRNPIEGVFGADSATWRVSRESALFLGAGRAALLQLAHPWVAVALDQHSSLLAKPIVRFHSTFRVVFTMVFGSAPQAFRAARSLYQRHTVITGELPGDVASYSKGSRYQALHLPALLWVYATLIDSAVTAYQSVLPPLDDAQLAAYYAESKILAGLFGLPPEALPADWPCFQVYVNEMTASQALGVDDRSRAMAQRIMTGAGSSIPIPRWYQALTAQWLPPRFREEFALPFEPEDQRRAQRAMDFLPRIYTKLPAFLRYVGPYREAQARIDDRAAGFITRRSNRFWIGQPRMPFAPNTTDSANH
ncbi:MAG TPA: oxygenase MpaB family protein [Terracidiphilus sp.]|nr:oxygenase MpaB family protein [Terracidiphilus sp.]